MKGDTPAQMNEATATDNAHRVAEAVGGRVWRSPDGMKVRVYLPSGGGFLEVMGGGRVNIEPAKRAVVLAMGIPGRLAALGLMVCRIKRGGR